jgi:hypothetical protein
MLDDSFSMRIVMVEQAKDQPYSCLTEVQIVANEEATKRYLAFQQHELDWVERGAIIEMLVDGTHDKDLRLLLEDEKPKTKEITMGDPKLGLLFHIRVNSRRLGEDTGRDILLDLGGQLKQAREAQLRGLRSMTREELITRTRSRGPLMGGVCAGHGTKLGRWKSSCQAVAEPKASERARASPRGGVWRKPNAKLRGDEQEPDTRCDTSGTSGHVTAKSSICIGGVFYKSGVYAVNVSCLTSGDLPAVRGAN